MQSARILTAPELYAKNLGARCEGTHECHWCGAPCTRLYIHDGPPPLPFVKNDLTAKRPANPYVCNGCRLFRRPRTTVRFLDGYSYKDGQCAVNYSWLVTDSGSWAIRREDLQLLWDQLFRPPLRFVLSLVDPDVKNHLQLAFVNDFQRIKADTPLKFTYNNIPHVYSVYELREAVQTGTAEGKESGVRAITNLLGFPPQEKRGRGRPTSEEQNRPERIVTELVIRKSA